MMKPRPRIYWKEIEDAKGRPSGKYVARRSIVATYNHGPQCRPSFAWDKLIRWIKREADQAQPETDDRGGYYQVGGDIYEVTPDRGTVFHFPGADPNEYFLPEDIEEDI